MDGKTLEEVRTILLDRWRRLIKGTEREESEASAASPQVEVIDIAQSLEQLGRETSLAEQERRELLAIEKALAKMAIGSFGICEDCGDEIPAKRLLVLPEARLCASCQAVEERQNARLRTPRVVAR